MPGKTHITELNVRFFKAREPKDRDAPWVNQGIAFDCPVPGCPENYKSGKAHAVAVPVRGFPGERFLKDADHRWERLDSGGDDLGRLTLNPSVDGTGFGCKFHGWVKGGEVTW